MKLAFAVVISILGLLAVLLMLVLVSYPVHASDEMSMGDYAREGLFAAMVVTDVAMTREWLGRGPQYTERNPLLGDRPSDDRLFAAGALTISGHYLIAHYLGQRQRHWFQYVTIGLEGLNLNHNINVGARVPF